MVSKDEVTGDEMFTEDFCKTCYKCTTSQPQVFPYN